jgi:hypothetical protein
VTVNETIKVVADFYDLENGRQNSGNLPQYGALLLIVHFFPLYLLLPVFSPGGETGLPDDGVSLAGWVHPKCSTKGKDNNPTKRK